MDMNCVMAVSAAVSAIAAAVVGYFSWRTVELARSNLEVAQSVAWFTGAMESHSDLQLRLAAKQAGVEVVWWDPTIEPVPHAATHKGRATLSSIYVYLPPELRAGKEKRPRRRSFIFTPGK